MPLDAEQTLTVAELGSELLNGLEQVSTFVRKKFRESSLPSSQALAGGSNAMVDGGGAARRLVGIRMQDREQLNRIQHEPFVLRLVVRWDSEEPPRAETLYISRGSAAAVGAGVPGFKLVTYAAPLGRIAEFRAGDYDTISIAGHERDFTILERVALIPRSTDGEWDAVNDEFEFLSWHVSLESVRSFIEGLGSDAVILEEDIPDVLGTLIQEGTEALLARQERRRQVIERMELRDQPILDRYQGEVFRLPLISGLVLLGPPGTGKTTTLIRRLAQKRSPEGLTDEERAALSAAGLGDSLLHAQSWAMFSPTELLKAYLRQAFIREGVPPEVDNLRTWDKQRIHLGKNVLNVLRSAESRGFQLDENAVIMADTSSSGGRRLYEEFSRHFEQVSLERLAEAMQELSQLV